MAYPSPLVYWEDLIVNLDIHPGAGSISVAIGAGSNPEMNEVGPESSESPASAIELDNFRVLVVEDESIIAMDEVMMLQKFGLNVAGIASTGDQAIQMTESLHPDLILMDIDLGQGIDGIDVFQRIRERISVRVIFITGHFSEDRRMHNIRQMKNTWMLRKPVDQFRLHEIVLHALSDEV